MKFLSNILVNAGLVVEGSTVLQTTLGFGTSVSRATISAGGLLNAGIVIDDNASATANVSLLNVGNGGTATNGGKSDVSLTRNFTASTVSHVYNKLVLSGTYTEVAGGGITRAIHINTTVGATNNYRAFEWTNNNGWGLYGSGTGLNYLNGFLLLGSTTSTGERLQVTGTAIISSNLTAGSFIRSGGTSTQYLMADGSVSTLTNPITGTGAAGQVSYWSGTSTQAGSNNLFWNAANNRLGINTSTPASALQVVGTVNATNVQTPLVFSSGSDSLVLATQGGTSAINIFATTRNVLIQNGGAVSDSGQRLQVTGEAIITSATTPQLRIDYPSGGSLRISAQSTANSFTLLDSQGYGFTHSTNQSGINARQTNINIWTQATDTTTLNLGGQDVNPTVARTRTHIQPVTSASTAFAPTSGTAIDYNFRTTGNSNFAPTSGTATYTQVQFAPVINQTGGANGVTRGLYVNPTLTAAADWRSIEWSNNSGWGLYGAGTANNYLAGNLGLGTTTPSNLGVITIAGNIIVRPNGTAGVPVETSLRFFGASDAASGASITTVDQSSYNVGLGFFTRSGGTVSEKFRIFNNGNISLQNGGTFTDSGQRLQVTGDTLLKGSGNTSATTALLIQNSSSTQLLKLLNVFTSGANTGLEIGDGTFANTTFIDIIRGAATVRTRYLDVRTSADILYITGGTGVGNNNLGFNYGSITLGDTNYTLTNTTQFNVAASITGNFVPTSGGAGFIDLLITPTINQTGGANGISRGLLVRPTLTAAADWRSIEWSNNTGWGLYGAGTSNNYLGGRLGLGTTTLTNVTFRNNLQISGSGTSYLNVYEGTIQNGVTVGAYYNFTAPVTSAASFTTTDVYSYGAGNATIGAGSAITNLYGFHVAALTAATNNYGFYGNISSATGRWNLYMNGTALNYMNGALLLGSTTSSGEQLQVTGTAKITGASSFGGNMTLSLNQNGSTNLTINNTTSGTASQSRLILESNASAGSFVYGKYSPATIGYKIITSNNGYIFNNTTGDIAILNDVAAGNIKFAAGSSSTAQMTLTSAGSLGIATTSPAATLHVNGTFISNALWTNSSSVAFWGSYSTAYGGLTWDAGTARIYATTGNALYFGANNATNQVVLDTSGNFLIGSTSSTGERFQVTGTAKITGATSLSSTLDVTGSAGIGRSSDASVRLFVRGSSVAGEYGIFVQDASANANFYVFNNGTAFLRSDLTVNSTVTATAFIPSSSTIPTNGMYLPVSNIIAWSTNSTHQMRLDASGSLLLGSTTSSGERLQVTGDTKLTGEILLSDTKTSIVNGDYSANFTKTYNNGATANNVNSYGVVSNVLYNLSSASYTGSAGFNAASAFIQASIRGNSTTKATQPFRSILATLVGNTSAMNISDFRFIDIKTPDWASVSGHNIDNIYGIRIAEMNGASGFTITNSWGVYQEGASDNNYFNGKVLIGTSTAGSSKLRVSGLPTSATGLSAGDIWNDSGTLKIA